MLQMMGVITEKYAPRNYIVAITDKMSASKAIEFEEKQKNKVEVHISQSRFTSIVIICYYYYQ